MIDWRIVLIKLMSRKFWAMVAGFVGGILAAVNFSGSAQITGLIMAFGSIFVYVFAEAIVDKARATNNPNN